MCPECQVQYSERRRRVLVTCCGLVLCKICAFKSWIHNHKQCWHCNKKLLFEHHSSTVSLLPGQYGILIFDEIDIPDIPDKINEAQPQQGDENNDEFETLSDNVDYFDPYMGEEFEEEENPVTEDGKVYEFGGHWYRTQPHRLHPQCRLCGVTCINVQSLKEHMLSHFRHQFRVFMQRFESPWICHLCNKVQKTKASLKRHLAWREDLFFEITGNNPRDYPELLRVNWRRDHVPEYRQGEYFDQNTRDQNCIS